MIKEITTSLEVTTNVEPRTCRHYVNGIPMVVHCHHYSTLYTQLAIDTGETELLAEVSEEVFYDLLVRYYKEHSIDSIDDRVRIATLYFAAMGLGKINVTYLAEYGGKVILTRSHLDRGWMRKWGTFDRPINYVTAGCCAGMAAAILDMSPGSFRTEEILSMVKGDPHSEFRIMRR